MKAEETVNSGYFAFSGLWDIPSACGLRILRTDENYIAIVSELYKKNPGSTVTDVPVQLATQICLKFSLEPEKLIYIEHNPETATKLSFYEEEFFRVHFTFDDNKPGDPRYEKISRSDLESILSEG